MKQSSLESFQILNDKVNIITILLFSLFNIIFIQKIEDIYGLQSISPSSSSQSFETTLPLLDAMETIYDVQRVQFSCSFEYKRKEKLISYLFSLEKNQNEKQKQNQEREYDYWLNADRLNQILQQWNSNDNMTQNSVIFNENST